MSVYDRRTTIDAPLERVWAFHSRVEGLEAVTPDWMGLCIESTIGPDGEPDPEILEAGTELSLSMQPLGVGPRQHWTSVITARERDEGVAYFRDEMHHGPFERWEHTHAFFADGDRTVMRDHVVYGLPRRGLGGIGRVGDRILPVSRVGFEAMFRARHRATKGRLERK